MSDAYALLVGSRPTPAAWPAPPAPEPSGRASLDAAIKNLRDALSASEDCARDKPHAAAWFEANAASYRAALAILEAAR